MDTYGFNININAGRPTFVYDNPGFPHLFVGDLNSNCIAISRKRVGDPFIPAVFIRCSRCAENEQLAIFLLFLIQ